MTDLATPNLPSRDFDATIAFYAPLGFEIGWRDAGWLILVRGAMQLEFFNFPDLNPATSSFGSCLRLDDIKPLYDAALAAGVPEMTRGRPRLQPPKREAWGGIVAALIDPDGTLLRLIQNGD